MDPSAAADNPEDARTESSEASSMSRRICVTDLNTPGSIGGGVAFPGFGVGSGGGGGGMILIPELEGLGLLGDWLVVRLFGNKGSDFCSLRLVRVWSVDLCI